MIREKEMAQRGFSGKIIHINSVLRFKYYIYACCCLLARYTYQVYSFNILKPKQLYKQHFFYTCRIPALKECRFIEISVPSEELDSVSLVSLDCS